jgi:hypothetical protein
MRRYLQIWALLSALAWAYVYAQSWLQLSPAPDSDSARFAYAAITSALQSQPLPEPPASARTYRAPSTFVSAYVGGVRRARLIGHGSLAEVISQAASQFARDPALVREHARGRLVVRVLVERGRGPLVFSVPGLSEFSLVPLRDGVVATLGERSVYLTPDDLIERGVSDTAIAGLAPDLSFGTHPERVRELLGREAGQRAAIDGSWRLQRVRLEALVPAVPGHSVHDATAVTAANLREAAREGALFTMRHQSANGRFAYWYDAQHNRAPDQGYNLTRHAGALYFLARAANQLDMPEARRAALRGLGYLRDHTLGTCGTPDRLCIDNAGRVEFGASALTALASAELLRGGEDPDALRLLNGLTSFILAQQRPDGELMHEFSREKNAPVDVQRMYFSGEAALALLAAYEQLHDARLLEAAGKVMRHLTGAGWSFFGSRYFYGEEHWTCQSAAKAASYMQVDAALAFCLRWGRWQHNLQYRAGITPWDVEGAFGFGPLFIPRLTTGSARMEALVPVYRVLSKRSDVGDVRDLRALIERGVGFLLRSRWAPGPEHLFAKPSAAFGGIPSSQAALRSRVDMVQHAGSAFLAWGEALELGY